MRKFTKKQRHEIYKSVLENFDSCCGLCSQIGIKAKLGSYRDVTDKSFPELFLFRPRGAETGDWWWSFLDSTNYIPERKQVLMFCIEMTK